MFIFHESPMFSFMPASIMIAVGWFVMPYRVFHSISEWISWAFDIFDDHFFLAGGRDNFNMRVSMTRVFSIAHFHLFGNNFVFDPQIRWAFRVLMLTLALKVSMRLLDVAFLIYMIFSGGMKLSLALRRLVKCHRCSIWNSTWEGHRGTIDWALLDDWVRNIVRMTVLVAGACRILILGQVAKRIGGLFNRSLSYYNLTLQWTMPWWITIAISLILILTAGRVHIRRNVKALSILLWVQVRDRSMVIWADLTLVDFRALAWLPQMPLWTVVMETTTLLPRLEWPSRELMVVLILAIPMSVSDDHRPLVIILTRISLQRLTL